MEASIYGSPVCHTSHIKALWRHLKVAARHPGCHAAYETVKLWEVLGSLVFPFEILHQLLPDSQASVCVSLHRPR